MPLKVTGRREHPFWRVKRCKPSSVPSDPSSGLAKRAVNGFCEIGASGETGRILGQRITEVNENLEKVKHFGVIAPVRANRGADEKLLMICLRAGAIKSALNRITLQRDTRSRLSCKFRASRWLLAARRDRYIGFLSAHD